MAISHVAAIGSNGSKTTGTTLAVTATPSTQPAVGDLIIVACARDDIANDPLTGDSISDGHGNTYTRSVFGGGATGTDSTAGNSINCVLFYCVLTVAWSGSTTVTWTHPSLDARGMQVEHFAPASGYSILFQETVGAFNPASTVSGTALTVNPVGGDDLVFGAVGVAIDSTSSITGDSDTTGGASWSSITANAGTSGGTAATNIFVATQYKVGMTLPAVQGYNVTGFTSAVSLAMVAVFHSIPTTGIAFIGSTFQRAGNTSGATLTPTIPANATSNDLMLIVVAGRPSSNASDGVTIAGGTDGWAQHGSTSYLAVAAVDDLSVQLWYKIHDGSESNPGVTVNSTLADSSAGVGWSAQLLAFRRVNTSTPFDVTPVSSSNGAAATWTPTAVTTSTANAMAISVVASSDDNALDFNTSQSFIMALGGADFDTSSGADHAVALAFKTVSSPGSVTQPTWSQTVNGNDSWVGIATALKPASSGSTVNGTADGTFTFTGGAVGTRTVLGTADGTFAVAGPATGTRTVLGQADGTFAFAGPATGTRATAGQAASTFAFTGDAVGTRTAAGQADGTFAFAAPATGTRTVLGFADGTFTFTAPASGTPTITGVADGTFAFAANAAGTRIVNGVVDATFVFSAPAAGLVVHLGVIDTTFAFTGPAVGNVSRAGVIDTLFDFTGPAIGTVTFGPNAFLLGKVLAAVVDTTIRVTVADMPINASVVTDKIEASVR